MAEQKTTRMKSTRKPLSEKAQTDEANAEKQDWLAKLQKGKETLGTTNRCFRAGALAGVSPQRQQ